MAPSPRVRWDRVGRLALLFVLALLLYLYIGPLSSLATTWHASQERQTRVGELEEVQARLRARRDELRDPRALEREARELGMVRPGERSYVVEGLPRGDGR